MNMYDSLFSQSSMLNERIARQLFEILPEKGPIMVIVDKDGHCWPSESEKFSKLNISDEFLRDLCSKIDDGTEPLTTSLNDYSIIATQLATQRTKCGYILIALEKASPQAMLANMDLIEILLNQVGLIAELIEKNAMIYELQIKHHTLHSGGESAMN